MIWGENENVIQVNRRKLIDKSLKTLCRISKSKRKIIPNKRTKSSDSTSFIHRVRMHRNLMEGSFKINQGKYFAAMKRIDKIVKYRQRMRATPLQQH